MWTNEVNAQSGLTPSEYNALVATLESTTPTSASLAPPFGNFYTVTHGESWPPLPADTMGLDFWDLGGGYYLLDDTSHDYSAVHAEYSFGGLFPTNGGSGGGGGFGSDFTPQVYTTSDLWLSNKSVINGVDNLIIYPPTNTADGVYNILYTTNLATEMPWEWLMQTAPGQTNLLITNATDPLGFYRLGPQSYWLAFPFMNNNGSPTFSLYITSPVGANGTVKIANQGNGPVVTVGNTNSDAAVLGTYTLANAPLNPFTYGLSGAPVDSYYFKGQYLMFYDDAFEAAPFNGDGATVGWVLVDSVSHSTLYFGAYGILFLNDVTWASDSDGNQTGPTTSSTIAPSLQNFSVSAGAATTISIPAYVMMNSYDTLDTNTVIAVTADGPISVYAVKYESELTTAFTVYPASMLGTNYCVLARPSLVAPDYQSHPGGQSEFAIVATADDTSVRIAPSTNANLFGAGGTNFINLTLQSGQSYEAYGADNTNDVTGTIITSDKPIAVFAGASDAFVPNDTTGDDNPLIQEQFPVEEWGTNALSLSFAGRTGGDSYRIVTTNDGITLYTNGIAAGTLRARAPFDTDIDGPVVFSASKPIQVAHFANGTLYDLQLGDPCEILLRPTTLYTRTNIVVSLTNDAVTGDFRENYMNIIASEMSISNTLVDGHLLGASNFTSIGAGYYGATVTLTNSGTHTVVSTQAVGADVYGSGVDDAYGYFGSLAE